MGQWKLEIKGMLCFGISIHKNYDRLEIILPGVGIFISLSKGARGYHIFGWCRGDHIDGK